VAKCLSTVNQASERVIHGTKVVTIAVTLQVSENLFDVFRYHRRQRKVMNESGSPVSLREVRRLVQVQAAVTDDQQVSTRVMIAYDWLLNGLIIRSAIIGMANSHAFCVVPHCSFVSRLCGADRRWHCPGWSHRSGLVSGTFTRKHHWSCSGDYVYKATSIDGVVRIGMLPLTPRLRKRR